ncbi:MAG: hypothetical protein LH606_09805 [Cytophagaceae bacterium]|nr:hypothetical protein [Cytophagaceae bacterium]
MCCWPFHASMGAAVLLKAIPEYNLQPGRVILECPFTSMRSAVQGRLRTMHLPASPLSAKGSADLPVGVGSIFSLCLANVDFGATQRFPLLKIRSGSARAATFGATRFVPAKRVPGHVAEVSQRGGEDEEDDQCFEHDCF